MRYRTDTFDSCFNGQLMFRQLTDLNLKIISSLPADREISALILKAVLYPPAETHSGASQHPRWNFCKNSYR